MCFMSFPNMISVNVQCRGNYSFNPISNDCSLDKNVNLFCNNENQFPCNKTGEMNFWPSNPNIYYICSSKTFKEVGNVTIVNNCLPWWPCTTENEVIMTSNGTKIGNQTILFPILYRCAVNEIFRDGNCVKDDLSTKIPPNSTAIIPDESENEQFECTKSGLFPDSLDCHSYYHNNGLMKSRHLTCPPGTVFKSGTLSCIRGNC